MGITRALQTTSSIVWLGLVRAARSGTAHSITILRYHAVSERPGPYTVSPATFARQIGFIRDRYPVVRLSELPAILAGANSTERRVVITFDDAFRNFVEHARPVLERFAIPSTLFVPTGLLGRSNEWDAETGPIVRRPIMGADEVQRLAAIPGVEIGSHTIDHPSMAGLKRTEMLRQATESRRFLEELTGKPITAFAYPFGQLDNFSGVSTGVLEEAGYEVAVTTHWGTLQSSSKIMALRRICLDETESPAEIRTMIEGLDDWRCVKEKLGFGLRASKRLLTGQPRFT